MRFISNKYKFFAPFFIFGVLIFFPFFALAVGINYGDILSQYGDTFIMSYGNTENPDFYNCTVSTLSCVDSGSVKPVAPVNNNSNSPAPKFSFSTSSIFKNNIHTRNFYLTNNITGKTYTESYKLSSWDTLGDEGTIVAFSPDYKTMVYLDDSSGYPVLYQLDLTTLKGKTFKGQKVFQKSFSISRFTITSENNLYFISNKDAPYAWNLYKYNFSTKDTSLITINASYSRKIRNFENGIVFFTIQGSSMFPVFYDEQKNQLENFSGFSVDDSLSVIDSEAVSLGTNLNGVLMTSKDFDKSVPHSLVIWLHGGPYRQTSMGFDPYPGYAVYDLILNQLTENNVAVLKLDYRGSYGYGANFAKAIIDNVGKGDVTDVMSALVSIKKDISVGDTYLLGNSYGGYLALRSIVAYPGDFNGAISLNGVTDWKILLGDLRNSVFNVDFGGAPSTKNTKLYNQASILSRVSNLANQKITLVQSQADKTIFPSQADLLYKALQNAGKNVEFYPYAGADHTFTKTSDIEGVCKNIFSAISLSIGDNCDFH